MKPLARVAVALTMLAGASPAAAGERAISTDVASTITAHGKSIIWTNDRELVLWHAGAISPFRLSAPEIELGSGADGRTVAVYTRCASRSDGGAKGCTVRAGKLTSASGTQVLYRERLGHQVPQADLHRGHLALAAGRGTWPSDVYVRPRGRRRLERLAEGARQVTIGSGFVAFETPGEDGRVIRTVDLETTRQEDVATDSSFDNDCRCTNGSSSAGNPVISGSYVYWLETKYPPHLSGGEVTTRVARARLGDPAARVSFYETAAWASTFALRGSRIVYGAETGGVFEVTDPEWRAAGHEIPSPN